jgi:hypothetical protein
MGDEVGAEPERLAELASALENLRDVLAQNVPVIVNTLEQYWNEGIGAPLSLAALKQAQARSVQDAADMRARSNLAAAWMANPANIDVVSGGMAYIPWSGSALDQGDAALQAQNLKTAVALARTDPAAARAMLAVVAQDLGDHAGDTAYLTAFWSQPGVNASAASLASLLRTTNDGGTIKSASKSDYSNVISVLASAAIPLGFRSTTAYMTFAKNLRIGLIQAGYRNVTVVFRGSSVTGIRFRTDEPVGDNPNDYDLAIADPDLLARAKALGIGLRGGGTRTGELTDAQAEQLGLSDIQEQLTQQGGRKVTFMIYQDEDAVASRGAYIVLPDSQEVVNYFDRQQEIAVQDQTDQEIQQAEQQVQSEVAEEEAEAEAEAEAMAMAEDDE